MNPLQDLDIFAEGHFEKQVFNPFDFQKVLIDEGNDPDINFFNDKSETVDTPYFSVDQFNSSSDKLFKNSFSILHINIRSLNKNFEKLREYLSLVKEISVLRLLQRHCVMMRKQPKIHYCSYQITYLFIKLGIMAREEEVWYYMSITVLILKY